MTHGKTYNKSPRRINHKATKSKTNMYNNKSRNYNAEVWGNHESKDIELIHCKCLRKFCM